jgi:hypothetical protein
MRDIGILLLGLILGIAVQRIAGDEVDQLLAKTVAGIEAFQETDGE